MSTSVESPRPQTEGDSAPHAAVFAAGVDVPGMMADRIGRLYATEERDRRIRRTEYMIRKALTD